MTATSEQNVSLKKRTTTNAIEKKESKLFFIVWDFAFLSLLVQSSVTIWRREMSRNSRARDELIIGGYESIEVFLRDVSLINARLVWTRWALVEMVAR